MGDGEDEDMMRELEEQFDGGEDEAEEVDGSNVTRVTANKLKVQILSVAEDCRPPT